MADSPVQPAPKLSQRKLAATQRGYDFQPLKPADREASISQLPDDPVALFHRFCPESLVEQWVVWTNSWATHCIEQRVNAGSAGSVGSAGSGSAGLADSDDDETEDISILRWVSTTVAEIYIFLAVFIYMGIHPEKRIEDYWIDDEKPGAGDPTHRIIKYMTYRRFKLLFRYLRIFDPFNEPADSLSRLVSRVTPWSDHIQQASTDLFQPGLKVAVDECMIRFTGRSSAKVTIPRKPIPEGLKIWVVADHGYFLRWMFHLPTRDPEIKFPQETDEPKMAPTQAVVLDLVRRLETRDHHVFFDNLFTTVELLRALRRDGNAATGTARTSSGIYDEHRQSKIVDNTGKLDWQYNSLEAVPTSDNLVNQIAWKDNALVLFMTTYFTGLEFQDVVRRRPTTKQPRALPMLEFFGDETHKVISQPSLAVEYNYNMGSVDIGDQLRSYQGYGHRIRRGPWQALAWTFLLEVILINTYILVRGSPDCAFKVPDRKGQSGWRRLLYDALIARYHEESQSRKRFRVGDEFTQMSQHKHVRSEKRAPCLACQGHQVGQVRSQSAKRQKGPVLGEIDGNSRTPRSQSNYRCDKCDVALCHKGNCWSFYHGPLGQ